MCGNISQSLSQLLSCKPWSCTFHLIGQGCRLCWVFAAVDQLQTNSQKMAFVVQEANRRNNLSVTGSLHFFFSLTFTSI